jgi:peroxiredoxin Q/BCP
VLRVGEQAPEFKLEDQHGEPVTLKALLAEGELILYFYPVDFTPICTAEACAFRDNFDDVSAIGTNVVGISPQDVASHRRFAESFEIPFPLLADPRKTAIGAYGVDGPFGFGVRRATFLIGRDGIVRNRVVSDLMVRSHIELLRQTVADAN